MRTTGVLRGREVNVGRKRVEVGRKVGAEVNVLVTRPGSLVRRVAVVGKVAVTVGVRVTEGVAVGSAGVRLGRSEGVMVGAVEVGKGPSSAPEVSARAVLVPLAPWIRSNLLPGSRNANHRKRDNPNIRSRIPQRRMLDGWLIVFVFSLIEVIPKFLK